MVNNMVHIVVQNGAFQRLKRHEPQAQTGRFTLPNGTQATEATGFVIIFYHSYITIVRTHSHFRPAILC